MKYFAIILIGMTLLSACSSTSEQIEPALEENQIDENLTQELSDEESAINAMNTSSKKEFREYSDEEILEFAYSEYKVPQGFYRENLESGEDVSDTITYLRQLMSNEWVFYCSNTLPEAQTRVEESIEEYNQRVDRDRILVTTTENEKYYEFKTVVSPTDINPMTYYLRYRVHKCNYLSNLINRPYQDSHNKEDFILGTFSYSPIDAESFAEFVEYYWFSIKGQFESEGSQVIETILDENEGFITYSFLEVAKTRGDWGVPDSITLFVSEYAVEKETGLITHRSQELRNIQGRDN